MFGILQKFVNSAVQFSGNLKTILEINTRINRSSMIRQRFKGYTVIPLLIGHAHLKMFKLRQQPNQTKTDSVQILVNKGTETTIIQLFPEAITVLRNTFIKKFTAK